MYHCRSCMRNTPFVEVLKFCPTCGSKALVSETENLFSAAFAIVEELAPNETSLQTANIVTYELGDFVKRRFYASIYPNRRKVCMLEAKIAMSDLLTQCRVICKREGWDFDELTELGIGRFFERVKERAKGEGK